jgi:hypothetical protein
LPLPLKFGMGTRDVGLSRQPVSGQECAPVGARRYAAASHELLAEDGGAAESRPAGDLIDRGAGRLKQFLGQVQALLE